MDFRVWAPRARSVDLVFGDHRRPMQAAARGWWTAEAPVADANDGYRFAIDGGAPLPDPRSRWQPQGVHGPSFLVDSHEYAWRYEHQPPPLASSILYELHVGTFTREGTYRGAMSKLDHLARLGVTHVELMPIAAFPGNRGWGYDGVDLYAPYAPYGTPADLKEFVDACHGRGLAVILDVVYNHLGPDGNYLDHFGPYFTNSYHTPWGAAVNLDQAGSTEVRRFFIENALMWLRDYRFDGLRLDAVHSFGDRSAVHFLEQLAREVEALSWSLGRELVLIAESDLNDPRLLWSRERGGYGLQAAWSDDFHHALHTVLTGEDAGYYRDFGRVADVAKALTDVYVYDGRFSEARGRNHGRKIGDLSPRRFVAASQNHDQVGNRARGERLEHLVGDEAARIAAGLTILGPCIPLLFQGEEWAASSPFQYFTDHQDPQLARAVSEGRRREFQEFGWQPGDVPDPAAIETFERSRLDWDEVGQPRHAAMLDWYRRLISFRKQHGALLSAPVTAVRADERERTLVIERGPLTMAVSFGDAPLSVACAHAPGDVIASRPIRPAEAGILRVPPRTFVCFLT